MKRIVSILAGVALTLGFATAAAAPAGAASTVTAGTVKIAGTAVVASTLTAKTSGWKPSGVKLSYQWYRSGAAIAGATKAGYAPTSTDVGATVTVKVTGSKSGHTSRSVTSAATSTIGYGAGLYAVNAGIEPGTYQASGGAKCYWERRTDATTSLDGIIANAYGITSRVIVTVGASDADFRSQDCGTWMPLPTSGSPASSFGEGQSAVGIQVKAGTYRTESLTTSPCRVRITSGFGGTVAQILYRNVIKTTPFEITVPASAAGVTSLGCGTWTLAN